jgi:electron transport complex protein RnfG
MTAKDLMKTTVNLVIIYLVGGIILTAVYAKTSPIMFIGEKKDKEEALKKMMPEAEVIEELGTWESHKKKAGYYVAKKGGEDIGYVVESYGKGYSSYIKVLTAVDKDLIVQKIEILKHGETPGLGDEILKEPFKKQFTGKDLEHIKLVKVETQEYIQAITGATISCRAVTEDAVKNGVKLLIERVRGKG